MSRRLSKRSAHRFCGFDRSDAQSLDTFDAEEMGKPVSEAFCNAAARLDWCASSRSSR